MWGHLVNPTALIPTETGDLREDRVGQMIKRVLDGLASEETRRAYRHALEMFLAFCDREGKPMLSAELVSSYRVSLVGEGKSSSTVGVHLAAIKALTRAAVMAGLMPAEVAAAVNDVKGAPRRGNRIGNWSPGSRRGSAFVAGRGEPQGQTRLCHPGSPTRVWAATDGAGFGG
jgi:hypothetical protein